MVKRRGTLRRSSIPEVAPECLVPDNNKRVPECLLVLPNNNGCYVEWNIWLVVYWGSV